MLITVIQFNSGLPGDSTHRNKVPSTQYWDTEQPETITENANNHISHDHRPK